MKADTFDVKTILSFERRYVIPTFQRDYEWTRDGQWELLFDDLEAVSSRLAEAREQATLSGETLAKAEKRVAPHFLGAIVIDGLPHSPGSIDLNSVIDGQQRLTTVQLLLRGVLDELLKRKSSRVPHVRRLIKNPEDVVQDPDEIFKLWPRRRDRDVWRVAMQDDQPEGDHLYLRARSYFAERAAAAMTGSMGEDHSHHVVDALLNLFRMVVISLGENDDAQVIFEVLNGRQTPLSATDLVKNLLFLRAELADEIELEELYDRHWAPLDDEWWKKEIGRGHAARGRRDVMLSSWLTAASRSEVNIGHLYGEVRTYLNAQERKVPDVLAELSRTAAEFRIMLERPEHLPERMRDAYGRIDRLSVTTAFPLLVWLRTLPLGALPPNEHLRAVTAIESWTLRRFITGANSRGYGKKFVDALQAGNTAMESSERIASAIEAELLDAAASRLTWPTDDDVRQAFLTRPFYDNVTQERVRMLLGAIDRQLHLDHPKGEQPTFNYDRLQVEHLLPQSWRKYWGVQSDDPATRTLLEQRREAAKNRIGNLTLITGDLNMPMSNGPWADKRAALQAHTNLRLNAGLTTMETWDEGTIDQRAAELAEAALRIWPRP